MNNETKPPITFEQLGFTLTRANETQIEWRKDYRIVRYQIQTKRFAVLGSPNYIDANMIEAMTDFFKKMNPL
jgi:hypothetical protein